MKVIITFCCDNLRKSKFMALEKPGKLWEFFLLLWPPCLSTVGERRRWQTGQWLDGGSCLSVAYVTQGATSHVKLTLISSC